MTDDDFEIDEERTKSPATRWEVYRIAMALRSLIADAHIHDLASQANDQAARKKASEDFKAGNDKLDELCNELLGLVEKKGSPQ